MALVDLLQDALARAGSRDVLREWLGLSKQQISRALLGQSGLGAVPVVRAAVRVQRHVLTALREAGEVELADALEPLLREAVSDSQRAVLDDLDALPPRVRQNYVELIAERAAESRRVQPATSKRRGAKR